MQTPGRPGCLYQHMENSLLRRVAVPRTISVKFDPKSRNIHRMDDELKDGHCRGCNRTLDICDSTDDSSSAAPGCFLPPGMAATAVMVKGFKITQPLCFQCANGVAVVMLDCCAEPGGVKAGSRSDEIMAATNYAHARKEKLTQYDEQRQHRINRAAELFQQQQAALANAPQLSDVLHEMDDGSTGLNADGETEHTAAAEGAAAILDEDATAAHLELTGGGGGLGESGDLCDALDF
jgi:hypothetical protein